MKNWIFKHLALLSIVLSINAGHSQANLDSIWGVWENSANHDTVRLNAIYDYIVNGYIYSDPDSAAYFAQMQYDFARATSQDKYMAKSLHMMGIAAYFVGNYDKAIQKFNEAIDVFKNLDDQGGIASSYNNIGLVHRAQGDLDKAIEYNKKSLEIQEQLGDKQGIASALGNLGIIYQAQGNIKKAIDYNSRCLKIQEEIKDERGIAGSLNNIANLLIDQGNEDKALEYFNRSIEIYEKMNDYSGLAGAFSNIGGIYHSRGDYSEAIKFFQESLKIEEKIGDKSGIAGSLSKLGNVQHSLGNLKKAEDYYLKSLTLREDIGDKHGTAVSYNSIGGLAYDRKDYKKAAEYGQKAYKLASEIGIASATRDASKQLYRTYKKMGDGDKALEMYEIYNEINDSLQDIENQKEIIRQDYQYEYEKQVTADSIRNAEAKKLIDAQIAAEHAENERQQLVIEQQQEEAKTQKRLSYYLYGFLALVLVFAIFIFNRFRVTNKQKKVIEEQKQTVESQKEKVDTAYAQLEDKNQEILDSIKYAKRIQSAILPPQKRMEKMLKNYFVLYKPKDIVAGDFYWLEEKDDHILFAAADCTGHGVPGAMVSVVCNNGLNRSVREHGLTDPGEILNKTREIVIEEFDKSEEDVQDGMDIALCSLRVQQEDSGKIGSLLQYAGAHNPLWVLRSGADEFEEYAADKQPIGKYEDAKPYNTHSLNLSAGDTLYIFSDGYSDQFGGDKGKKLKAKNFMQLLLSVKDKSLAEQAHILDKHFEDWKGSHEQLDDVCVIGVRV